MLWFVCAWACTTLASLLLCAVGCRLDYLHTGIDRAGLVEARDPGLGALDQSWPWIRLPGVITEHATNEHYYWLVLCSNAVVWIFLNMQAAFLLRVRHDSSFKIIIVIIMWVSGEGSE